MYIYMATNGLFFINISRRFLFAALAHPRHATNRKRHVDLDSDSGSFSGGRGFSDSDSGSVIGGWVIWIRIRVRLEHYCDLQKSWRFKTNLDFSATRNLDRPLKIFPSRLLENPGGRDE